MNGIGSPGLFCAPAIVTQTVWMSLMCSARDALFAAATQSNTEGED